MSNPTPSTQPAPRSRLNVYTCMLIVSFAALLIATALLAYELISQYGSYPWWNTGGS